MDSDRWKQVDNLLQSALERPPEQREAFLREASSGDEALEKAIARFAGPKGNLQFPLDESIPYDLIERIVKLRVKQDSAKAEAKRKKKSPISRKPRVSK